VSNVVACFSIIIIVSGLDAVTLKNVFNFPWRCKIDLLQPLHCINIDRCSLKRFAQGQEVPSVHILINAPSLSLGLHVHSDNKLAVLPAVLVKSLVPLQLKLKLCLVPHEPSQIDFKP
jgi:hypothetical protein